MIYLYLPTGDGTSVLPTGKYLKPGFIIAIIMYLFVLQVEIFMLWIHIGCQALVLGHVAKEPLRKQYASIKKRMILHIQKLLVS